MVVSSRSEVVICGIFGVGQVSKKGRWHNETRDTLSNGIVVEHV